LEFQAQISQSSLSQGIVEFLGELLLDPQLGGSTGYLNP
jgi:hypothetical protein